MLCVTCLEPAGFRVEVQAGNVVGSTDILNEMWRGDSVIDLWMGDQRRLPDRNGLWARTQMLML